MKKIFFLLLAAASFNAKGQVRFGVRAGLSLSSDLIPTQSASSTFQPTTLKAGFYMGFTAQIPVSPAFSIVTGLGLAQKGYHEPAYRDTSAAPHVSDAYNLTYTFIDVPVLADLKISKNINIQFGPQVSFLIKGTMKTTGPYSSGSYPVDNTTPKVVFGLVGGAQVHVWKQVSFSLHYNIDLQTHIEDPSAFNPLAGLRNQSFQAGLVYQLPRRK